MPNITPQQAAQSIIDDVYYKKGRVMRGYEGLDKVVEEFGGISYPLQYRKTSIYYLDGSSEPAFVHFASLDGTRTVVDLDHGRIAPIEFDNQEDAISFVREMESYLKDKGG